MHDAMMDLRYALRGLRQKPLFAAIAILSIAIGVGANASIFSVINALLLRPPAGVNHPERVVEVGRTNHGGGFDTFGYPELQDITHSIHSVDRVAGIRDLAMSFTNSNGAGERITAMAVSQPYFDVLGAAPQRGRFFTTEEDNSTNAYVVVISDQFWKKKLGGRADIVGATIELNRQPFTVIGVTAPSFRGHIPLVPSEAYLPLKMFSFARPGVDGLYNRQSSWMNIIARVAPGASLDRVNADLTSLFKSLALQYPEVYNNDNQRSARALMLTGIPGAGHTAVAAFLSLLMGMVALVLLTTCANVAGMLLARAAGREREIAIRLALGSGRARLVRQLLVESTTLFLAGGVLGLALSVWGMKLLSAISLPIPITLSLDFTPDARVFVFGLTLAMATGMLFGLAPALQSTKPELVSALKNEGRAKHSRGGRMRRIFVGAQVTFSLILLICAGLFVRSLQAAAHVDAGFDAKGVRVVSFSLDRDGYDEVRGKELIKQLTSTLAQTPGVTGAAVANDLPLDLSSRGSQSFPDQYGGKDGFNSNFTNVSAGYFDAMRIRVLQGRAFNGMDTPESQKVVVVSRMYADKVWPGQNPIGKLVRWEDSTSEKRTVVGVVADVKTQTVMEETQAMFYLPVSQVYTPDLTLVVRTRLSAADANAAILRGIQAVDSKIALTPIQSLAGVTSVGVLPQRMAAIISVVMGSLALILAGMGVYGVIAYMVTQRTREIGVRVALGARREDVVSMVVKSGVKLAAPGLLIGLVAGLALSRVVRSFILGVSPGDPVTFIGVPLLLLAMIAIATWVPARRASRVTPMEALRAE